MKKVLLLLLWCSLLQFSAKAQLADGSTAPDWTLSDLNGVSYNLYSMLDSGYTVFIDCSAAWCGPCWAYHTSGELERLYEEHGPNGTCSNGVRVFYIEGETTNTTAQLTGTSSGNGYDTFSQGDWVTGTSYPIIDAPDDQFNSDYNITYFPTIYRICPDRIVKLNNQLSVEDHVASMSECGFTNDVKIAASGSPISCGTSFAPIVRIDNLSVTSLTSANIYYAIDGGPEQIYNWSGSVAMGSYTDVTLPAQTLAAGDHAVEYHLADPNAIEDGNGANNCTSSNFSIVDAVPSAFPFANDFTVTPYPYNNWTVINPDNDLTWTRVNVQSGALKLDYFNYASPGQIDEIIIEPLDLSTVTEANLSFQVAYKKYDDTFFDGMGVMVSDDCGETWNEVYYKDGSDLATVPDGTSAFTPNSTQWRQECVDLSSYAGSEKVFISFRGYNGYGNNLYIDKIVVDAQCVVSVGEQTSSVFENVSLYPNPADNHVTLNYSIATSEQVVVELVDLIGNIVEVRNLGNQSAGTHQHDLVLDNVAAGIYVVNFRAGNSSSYAKLTVKS